MASEKKYFPQRKRKGKRGGEATADGEEAEPDQSTNLLGDATNSTANTAQE